jgi:hypothetical protein
MVTALQALRQIALRAAAMVAIAAATATVVDTVRPIRLAEASPAEAAV